MSGLRWVIKKIRKQTGLTGEELVKAVMSEIDAKEYLLPQERKEILAEVRERILGQ